MFFLRTKRLSFSYHRLTGFTLLEVLIALMVLSVIMVAIFTIFSQALNTWRKAAADMEKYGNARAFLDRISTELSGTTITSWDSIFFLGSIEGSGPIGTFNDELFFVSNMTTSSNTASHLAEIGYWLDDDDDKLYRYYRDTGLDFENLSYDLFTTSPLPADATIEVIAENIEKLFFSYWRTGATVWDFPVTSTLRTWDSRTNAAISATPADFYDDGKLPKAIKITLTIKDKYTQNDENFSTVIYIPKAELFD
ncbi:prepilin-type N-terminal cleavage/methylation domain-containing protein [Candidatus Auribacterota bacterium]